MHTEPLQILRYNLKETGYKSENEDEEWFYKCMRIMQVNHDKFITLSFGRKLCHSTFLEIDNATC